MPEDRRELSRHLNVLERAAHKHLDLDLKDPIYQIQFPQLVRFFKLKDLEKERTADDAEQMEKEKADLLGWIKVHQLTSWTESFQSFPKADIRSFLERFYEAAHPKGFSFKNYPHLSREFARLILSSELDSFALFKEVNRLNRLLIQKLAKTKAEKKLVRIAEDALLLSKLLSLEISRAEFGRIVKRNAQLKPSDLAARIEAFSKMLPSDKETVLSSEALDRAFEEALRFYELAEKRETFIFDHVLKTLKEKKAGKAILVTGGYHAEGLGGFFKHKGFSYVSVRPRMNQLDSRSAYLDQMLISENQASTIHPAQIDRISLPQLARISALDHRVRKAQLVEFFRTEIGSESPNLKPGPAFTEHKLGWDNFLGGQRAAYSVERIGNADTSTAQAFLNATRYTLNAGSKSELRSLLGFKKDAPHDLPPILKEEIPAEFLLPALAKLRSAHPELYSKFQESVKRRYFVDTEFMDQISALVQEDENAYFVDEALKNIDPMIKDLLIYLDLVFYNTQLLIDAGAERNINASLVGFVSQVKAYRSLSTEEKAILKDNLPDNLKGQVLPVLAFMDQFAPDSLDRAETLRSMAELIAEHLGLGKDGYDPKIAGELFNLLKSKLAEGSTTGTLVHEASQFLTSRIWNGRLGDQYGVDFAENGESLEVFRLDRYDILPAREGESQERFHQNFHGKEVVPTFMFVLGSEDDPVTLLKRFRQAMSKGRETLIDEDHRVLWEKIKEFEALMLPQVAAQSIPASPVGRRLVPRTREKTINDLRASLSELTPDEWEELNRNDRISFVPSVTGTALKHGIFLSFGPERKPEANLDRIVLEQWWSDDVYGNWDVWMEFKNSVIEFVITPDRNHLTIVVSNSAFGDYEERNSSFLNAQEFGIDWEVIPESEAIARYEEFKDVLKFEVVSPAADLTPAHPADLMKEAIDFINTRTWGGSPTGVSRRAVRVGNELLFQQWREEGVTPKPIFSLPLEGLDDVTLLQKFMETLNRMNPLLAATEKNSFDQKIYKLETDIEMWKSELRVSKLFDEFLRRDSGVAQNTLQRPAIKFLVIGNNERGFGSGVPQFDMAAALADFDVTKPFESSDGFPTGDERRFHNESSTIELFLAGVTSLGFGSRYSLMASRMLARASARVFPWLQQPRSEGHFATTYPSRPRINTILSFILHDLLLKFTHPAASRQELLLPKENMSKREDRPELHLSPIGSSTTPSAVRLALRSELRDFLGAKRADPDEVVPIVKGKIPDEFFSEAYARLRKHYPRLYNLAFTKPIKRQHFAGFMTQAALLSEEGEESELLIDEFYRDVPPDVKNILLYLHLVHALTQHLFHRQEKAPLDPNLSVLAHLMQTHAYHRLTPDEKKAIAEYFKTNTFTDVGDRYLLVLGSMEEVHQNLVLQEENVEAVLKWMGSFPGVKVEDFNLPRIRKLIERSQLLIFGRTTPKAQPAAGSPKEDKSKVQRADAALPGKQPIERLAEMESEPESLTGIQRLISGITPSFVQRPHVGTHPSADWVLTGDTVDGKKDIFKVTHSPSFKAWRISNYLEDKPPVPGAPRSFELIMEWPARGGREPGVFKVVVGDQTFSVPSVKDPIVDGVFIRSQQTFVAVLEDNVVDALKAKGLTIWSRASGGKPFGWIILSKTAWKAKIGAARTDIVTAVGKLVPPFKIHQENPRLIPVEGEKSDDDIGIQIDPAERFLKYGSEEEYLGIEIQKEVTRGSTQLGKLAWKVYLTEGEIVGMISISWSSGRLVIDQFMGGDYSLGLEDDPFVNLVFDYETRTLILVITNAAAEALKKEEFSSWDVRSESGGFGLKIMSEDVWQVQQFVYGLEKKRSELRFDPTGQSTASTSWEKEKERSELRSESPASVPEEVQKAADQILPYYQAKQELIEAAEARDRARYWNAFQAMERIAKQGFWRNYSIETLTQALEVIRASGKFSKDKDVIAEPREIARASAEPLKDEERRAVREVAREVAAALAAGDAARSLEELLVSNTRVMNLRDMVPADIGREGLSEEALKRALSVLGHADKMHAWAVTELSYEAGKPTRIGMRSLDDFVHFRVAYLHEAIHLLSHHGLLPIMGEHELITHASTAIELVRAKGTQGLRDFADDLYVRLFERGEEVFAQGLPIGDLDWVLDETRRIGSQFLREKQTGEPKAEEETPVRELTPDDRRQQYFDFERFAGTLLGGYAWAKEQKTGENALKFTFKYASDVMARTESILAPLAASPENKERAAKLRTILEDTAKMLSRDRQLEIVDWNKTWTGSDVPEVRYLPDLHKMAVPLDVWFLDEAVAKGLVAQEIFRALYAKPDLIEPEFKKNRMFTELWYSSDTPRVIEKGAEALPGARQWVDRLYSYRHTISHLPLAQQMMDGFPLPFQYLAGIFWLWHKGEMDPRIRDSRARGALEQTKSALQESFLATPERHYEIARDILWPVVQKLWDDAVKEGMEDEMMRRLVRSEAIQLGEEHKAAAKQGNLHASELNEEERRQFEKAYDALSPEEQEALRKQIEANMKEFAKNYEERLGGQPLRGLVIQSGAQQAGAPHPAGGMSQLFPDSMSVLMPGKGGGMELIDLSNAMQLLVSEAQELEKLASLAEETAQQLRDKAAEFQDKQAALELANRLDELAKTLHQQAEKLHKGAVNFNEQAQETQKSISEGTGNIPVQAQELVQQAGELVAKSGKLENSAKELTDQTSTLKERMEQDPSSVSEDLAQAFSGYTELLKDEAGQVHEHAKRIEAISQALGQAMQQGAKAMGFQAGPAAQQGGQGGRPEDQKLQEMDFSPLDVSPKAESSAAARREGGAGYGPGLTSKIVEEETKEPTKVRPAAPSVEKKTKSETAKPSAPVTTEQREKAREVLKKVPEPSKKRPASPVRKQTSTPAITSYKDVKRVYAPQIARLRREIMSALQQTEMGGKIGGLVEGEYLDDDEFAQLKGRPPQVMAIDILPKQFNYRISYLIDVSGSMFRPESGDLGQWITLRLEGGDSVAGTLIQRAREGAAILMEATNGIPGIEIELYAFDDNAAIRLKDYRDHKTKISEKHAAEIYDSILRVSGGGTADVAAIQWAVKRIREGREGRPGLRIFGIGIGEGTEKVKEAYAPHGYMMTNPADFPDLMRQILRKQLTGREKVHNIIIVLTDGNPGARNAEAIQKIAHDNRDHWVLRAELRSLAEKYPDLPFKYAQRFRNDQMADVLIIDDQELEIGPGGTLAPSVEILHFDELALPKPESDSNTMPAEYVARLMTSENGRKQRVLIPLSPHNMKVLAKMISVLSSRERPNLYLRGPAAGGKNTLLYLLAGLSKWPVYLMSLNYDTTKRQLVALQTFGESGKEETKDRPSPMVQAAGHRPSGGWGVADEVNKPQNTGVLAAWYSLLEHRFITMPDGRVVIARPGYRAVAMGNPDHPPYLVSEIPVDFERRFQFVDMDYLHAPKRKGESNEEVEARLNELVFILMLSILILLSKFFQTGDVPTPFIASPLSFSNRPTISILSI